MYIRTHEQNSTVTNVVTNNTLLHDDYFLTRKHRVIIEKKDSLLQIPVTKYDNWSSWLHESSVNSLRVAIFIKGT